LGMGARATHRERDAERGEAQQSGMKESHGGLRFWLTSSQRNGVRPVPETVRDHLAAEKRQVRRNVRRVGRVANGE
jgi:hypothetical protein